MSGAERCPRCNGPHFRRLEGGGVGPCYGCQGKAHAESAAGAERKRERENELARVLLSRRRAIVTR